MPKGKPIPNMMDNEYFEIVYHCLKNNDGSINFKEVAVSTGLKDASAAKSRLQLVMKAQEKAGPHQRKQAATKPTQKRVKADREKDDKTAKKRKFDEVEVEDEEDDDNSESDLPNEKTASGEVRKVSGSQARGDGEEEV